MKKKNTYMVALVAFLAVITFSLIMQYPHFKFQLETINDDHEFSYAYENEKVQLLDYYALVSENYGGATLLVESSEPSLKVNVELQSGEILKHQATKKLEGTYVLDVLKVTGELSKPKRVEVLSNDGSVLYEGDMSLKIGELYQASNYDYAFLNIYINQAGVFMGRFEAFDLEALNAKTVTVEFCHEDESKSSGYQLLARSQMDIDTFTSQMNLGYIPFLKTANYDENRPVEVIVTFESDTRQTIVMSLEKGVN